MAAFAAGFKNDVQLAAITSTTATYEGGYFGLGDAVETHDGKRYMFVNASTSITSFQACAIDSAFSAQPLTSATALVGPRIGVAPNNISSGSWGWVQIYGACSVSALSTCSSASALYATATAGAVDDTGTATLKILGLSIAANITAAATTTGIMQVEPFISF